MLVAAAVCPCPPLLVPDVASGATTELEPVRTACAAVLDGLAAARPDHLVVVAPDAGTPVGGVGTRHPSGAVGSFHRYGVPLTVTLGAGAGQAGPLLDAEIGSAADPDTPLPAALTVGAWLLTAAGWSAAPVTGLGVPPTLSPEECRATGRALASGAGRTALLVLGDGSHCRSRQAPGYLDERAEGFDAAVVRALGGGDAAALAALDPALAAELGAEGRAGWQLLAGAAEGAGWSGRVAYADAPYGVGYVVAAWNPTDRG